MTSVMIFMHLNIHVYMHVLSGSVLRMARGDGSIAFSQMFHADVLLVVGSSPDEIVGVALQEKC